MFVEHGFTQCCVYPCYVCDYYRGSRDGIQPERLNAEGEARVLLAEG